MTPCAFRSRVGRIAHPVVLALANAIYAATGKRVTRLPMTVAGVESA
jgi:CO/xanthine dehydrogenase Mo-binding subunit